MVNHCFEKKKSFPLWLNIALVKKLVGNRYLDLKGWKQCHMNFITHIHTFNNATMVLKIEDFQLPKTVEPRPTTTLLIRTPRYYGQFLLVKRKFSHNFSQETLYTIRPFRLNDHIFWHGSAVLTLTRFHWKYYH